MHSEVGVRLRRPDDVRVLEKARPSVTLAVSLLNSNRLALGVNIATGALMVVLSWGALPFRAELIWAACFLVLVSEMARRLLRRPSTLVSAKTARRILERAWVWASVHGLLWGATSLFLPWLSPDRQMAAILVAMGMCAGSVSILAASPRAAHCFVTAAGVPYVLYFAWAGSYMHVTMTAATVVFLIALIGTAAFNHKSLRWAARAQFRAAQLGTENAVAQDHLEVAVAHAAELETLRDQAEAASVAKTRFLANISHELRTPLNAVIGFSDLSEQHALQQGDAKLADYAHTINMSGRHLLAIVDDLLDLARIETGHMKLSESRQDLNMLAREAVALGAGARADQVTQILPVDAVMARVDPRLIKQALINLIGNALKFTHTDAPQPIVLRVLRRADGGAALEVRDAGIGIPAHKLAEVLQPFAQVEETDNRRYGGVGLGLPLAKQFMELHGGTLELESVEGQGATVRLILPPDRIEPGSITQAA